MNVVTLLQPPRIVFGNGSAGQCVELFAQRGVKRLSCRVPPQNVSTSKP